MTVLDAGRIGIASQALGIAEAAYEASIEYARNREAFGAPIGSFEMIQAKIADMKTRIEASRLLIYSAALAKQRAGPLFRQCRAVDQQPRRLDPCFHVRDLGLDHLEAADWRAERLPVAGVFDRRFICGFRDAKRLRRDADPSGVEYRHGDLESS